MMNTPLSSPTRDVSHEASKPAKVSCTPRFVTTLGAICVSAAILWAACAAPAASETQEDAAFAAKVREALLANPEIILEVFALLEDQQTEAEATAERDLVASVAKELFKGLDLAKPILVEFQDYNCGYCRRAHAAVSALKKATPDLQLVLLELPILGEGSRIAAETALAVKAVHGKGAYLRFAEALMTMEGPANRKSVEQMVHKLGFNDGDGLTDAVKGAQAELRRVKNLAARIGASGTPYFVGPSGIARGAASMARMAEIAAPQNLGAVGGHQ